MSLSLGFKQGLDTLLYLYLNLHFPGTTSFKSLKLKKLGGVLFNWGNLFLNMMIRVKIYFYLIIMYLFTLFTVCVLLL